MQDCSEVGIDQVHIVLEDEQDYITGLDSTLGVGLDEARGAMNEIAIVTGRLG